MYLYDDCSMDKPLAMQQKSTAADIESAQQIKKLIVGPITNKIIATLHSAGVSSGVIKVLKEDVIYTTEPAGFVPKKFVCVFDVLHALFERQKAYEEKHVK